MTQSPFLRFMTNIAISLELIMQHRVRYYVVIGGKLTYNGYDGVPLVSKSEFMVSFDIFHNGEWLNVHFHKEDKVEDIAVSFEMVISALCCLGIEHSFNQLVQKLSKEKMKKELAEREKELKELAEAERIRLDNLPWYKKIPKIRIVKA